MNGSVGGEDKVIFRGMSMAVEAGKGRLGETQRKFSSFTHSPRTKRSSSCLRKKKSRPRRLEDVGALKGKHKKGSFSWH